MPTDRSNKFYLKSVGYAVMSLSRIENTIPLNKVFFKTVFISQFLKRSLSKPKTEKCHPKRKYHELEKAQESLASNLNKILSSSASGSDS